MGVGLVRCIWTPSHGPPEETTGQLQPLSQQVRLCYREMGEAMRVRIPLQLKRGLNSREHHMARHRRVLKEREAVSWAFKPRSAKAQLAEDRGRNPDNRWVVVLTRLSPGRLDDDNLAGAFKAVRDQVADELGLDDGDERLKFLYAQSGCPAKERFIEIEVLPFAQWLQEETDRLLFQLEAGK